MHIYVYIYMHKLADSCIFSVLLYSSNIDVEFIPCVENEEVCVASERH
jgi:hypothetical protein